MDTRNNPLDDIYWRDELLQILYWFQGEGLGEVVSPRDLLVFLNADEALIQHHLNRLVDEGYATHPDGLSERYQLTPLGVIEGGRRFADEFSGLTGQAHGECNNADCSCKTYGPAACEAHTPHRH